MSWTAIWNHAGSVLSRDDAPAEMADATFLLEGQATRADTPVSLWRGRSNGGAALSIQQGADGAVALQHRALDIRSEPGFLRGGEAFAITYQAGEARQGGQVTLKNLDRAHQLDVALPVAQSLLSDDFLLAGPEAAAFPGMAALANHDAPIADLPGLEVGTAVLTPAGPVAAEALHPGAIVLTERGEAATVQSVAHHEAVTLGAGAAVRLRAPYFGLASDIVVSRHSALRLSGPEVEYTFGTETVLCPAGDMIDNVAILRDQSQPVRSFVSVDLDRPGSLCAGRARILAAPDIEGSVIDRAGAQTLMAMTQDPRGLIG